MLLYNILIFFSFFFSLFYAPLSVSAISFSCSFLLSKFSLFLLNFFTQILFFFFSNFFSLSSQFFSLLCEGLFFCCVGVGVVGHAMGVRMVGHRRHGHAVGMVGHRFRVMPRVWVCAMVFGGLAMVGHNFMFLWVMPWGLCVGSLASWLCRGCARSSISGHAVGVGCCGFYFCSCGLIFLGSCGSILGVSYVKWWLIGGSSGLCEVVVNRWW